MCCITETFVNIYEFGYLLRCSSRFSSTFLGCIYVSPPYSTIVPSVFHCTIFSRQVSPTSNFPQYPLIHTRLESVDLKLVLVWDVTPPSTLWYNQYCSWYQNYSHCWCGDNFHYPRCSQRKPSYFLMDPRNDLQVSILVSHGTSQSHFYFLCHVFP